MTNKTLVVWLVAGLVPVIVNGQAGLFWDNSEKLRTSQQWEGNTRGSSALGQLESLAGRKVDTSRVPQASQPQRVQQAKPRVVHKPHSLSVGQQMGVSLFGAILENVLMDSSSGNAAANAQALEQQRIAAELQRQQQLQKMRMLHNQWRAEWDERDQTTTDQLAGAFSSPVSTTSRSTSFFGIPGGVDPKALLADVNLNPEDTSVVDLRGSQSLAVSLPAQSVRPKSLSYRQTNQLGNLRIDAENLPDSVGEQEQSDEWQGAKSYARWTWDKYKDKAKSEAEEYLLDQIPGYSKLVKKIEGLPGVSEYQKLKKYKEFYDKWSHFLSSLTSSEMDLIAYGGEGVISGRLDSNTYFDRLLQFGNKTQDDLREKAVDEVVSHGGK